MGWVLSRASRRVRRLPVAQRLRWALPGGDRPRGRDRANPGWAYLPREAFLVAGRTPGGTHLLGGCEEEGESHCESPKQVADPFHVEMPTVSVATRPAATLPVTVASWRSTPSWKTLSAAKLETEVFCPRAA